MAIYEFCHNCNDSIHITEDTFWLKHGKELTQKERKEYSLICDGCLQELREKHDKEKEEIRRRIRTALS